MEQGREEGIRDHRHEIDVSRPLLSAEQQELAAALGQPPEDGGLWSGPKVAQWMGYSSRVPRPQHAKADEESQQALKKTARAGRGRAASPSADERRTVEYG